MSTKDLIKKSVLENFSTDISLAHILLTMTITLLLALYIFYIYRFCKKSCFYSADFNKTLAIMSVITAAIVLAMQSNLVISLGMVGALSIVRFRNAVKDSIDLVFLFWSISIGIICGAGLYGVALLTSLFVTLLLLLLDYVPAPKASMLLVLNSSSIDSMDELSAIISRHCSVHKIKSQNLTSRGLDLIVEIKGKEQYEKELLTELSSLSHVTSVSLLSHEGEKRF